MALIDWNQQYSVNIKEIDEQHKVLINLINNLHDAMKVGKGKEALGSILKELIDYTVKHFSFEEKLFSTNGYPDSKSHKEVHASLIGQVQELKNNFENENNIVAMDVKEFLKNWLTGHIMGTDKKYTNYLNAKGIF